jgi:hypothetical protein
MRIFSFKSMIGLLAIGGVIAYVRKQGGIGNAVESLKKLVSGIGGKAEDKAIGSNSGSATERRPGGTPTRRVAPPY